MGLDIFIATENDDDLYPKEQDTENGNYYKQHSLSRTFCNLMLGRHECNGEPELEQIGRITGVDINVFYEMEEHPQEDELEYRLSSAANEEERQEIMLQAEHDKTRVGNNLDKVLLTVTALLDRLSLRQNIPDLIIPDENDVIGINEYFSDFSADKGDGYMGNNFGQDLRNFKRFLEYAKSKGRNTVFFLYG